ncbi:rolling circle replication-associated protein [Stenotrophomonas maltophilia]|uniref:rolling circle replication-associated protein n=1 Tax=Stenotrophomonas maltophilia TaxID=40324 RepID=UPI000DA76762|nr:adhesin [Stenotrophomonas maltophilia]PZT09759.1 adhesin [Stenotrophomonas maltophilia]
MEITTASMKQARLTKLAKGVKASALAIDMKFRDAFGAPILRQGGKKGVYARNSPYRVALITLTYRHDGQWDPGHISALIKHYREWFRRNAKGQGVPEFHYVWVMELTEIGRPHYHIVAWMPKGVTPPLPDQQGWWPHGSTNAVFAKSPVGYITKYASKAESKSGHHLPKGARLWGFGGLKMVERAPVAFATAPRWLKGVIHHESHPKKRHISITEKTKFGASITTKVSAWVLTAGLSAGWAFFSPFDYDGFTGTGIALSHRGHIEVLTPDGDQFHIPHRSP